MLEEHIRTLVREAVNNHLQSAHVVDVLAERGADFDGEDIICITIIVDAPPSAFNRQRLAGLVTHLREALAQNNEDDFPMVSFRSRQEFEAASL